VKARSGFGLLGLIILLAVLAILAGTVGPLLFREFLAAREAETRAHLEALNQGLMVFYRDTGRLPTEAEGLASLVTDPGIAGWQGPYVGAGREAAADAVALDAWSRPLAYDRTPVLSAGAAAAIIVSGGGDRRLGSGTIGGLWTVGGTADGTDGHDDLQSLVDTDGAASEMEALTRARMEAISQAAQEYFRVQGRFPDALSDLAGAWLPPSPGADALADGWGLALSMAGAAAAHPPTAVVTSRGADGVAGNADDLDLGISSAAGGRRTTLYELGIAQAAVDADTSRVLTGNWAVDRAALNLDDILAGDGWGVAYGVRVSTRTVLSAGPDADYLTAADNLPAGVVPDGPTP
jgi:general secretion pathway protein G